MTESYRKIGASIVQYLRSHNLSYSEAQNALNFANETVSAMVQTELDSLPMGDWDDDITDFKPSARRIVPQGHYKGVPLNFAEWISEDVWGLRDISTEDCNGHGTPIVEHAKYRIYKTTNDDYALQETMFNAYYHSTNPAPCGDHVIKYQSFDGYWLFRGVAPTTDEERLESMYRGVSIRHRVIATGDITFMVEKHNEHTHNPPKFIS